MSKAARSLLVFGLYLIGVAILLTVTPNSLLALLRLPPTGDPWIRVLGVVVGVLGAYYVAAARQEFTAFFRATVWGRTFVPLAFALLVVLRLAPPMLLAFGLIDMVGALWTRGALHSQRNSNAITAPHLH